MKICLYSHVFLPRVGGVQTSSHQLAEGLTDLGHCVTIVTEIPADPDYDRQFPFKVVRITDPDGWPAILKEHDILVSNGFSLKYLWKWRRGKIPFGWIHAMALGSPKITDSVFWYFRYQSRRMALSFGDFNICVSQWMKQHIKKSSAVVLPNALDPIFQPPAEPVPIGKVAYFGRMWLGKGLATLVDAMKICRQAGREVPVDFWGEGTHQGIVEQQARDLGVSDLATFHPFLRGPALVQAIQQAKFVVVPTIVCETFGLVAAEAMACGRCVIGSKDGGMRELLEGVCPIFDNGNAQQLADCMIDLLDHPEDLRRREALALERSKLYSRDRVCRQYADFFQSVVDRKKKK